MTFSKNGFVEKSPGILRRSLAGLFFVLMAACQKDPLPEKSPTKIEVPFYQPKSFLEKGLVESPWGLQEIWFRDYSRTHIIVEGDMLLPRARLLGSEESISLGAFGVMMEERLWPEGIIRYDFEPDLDSRLVQAFEAGVKAWNEKTKYTWVRKDADSSVYHVLVKRWYKGGGLSSVGRSPESGKQYQEVLLDLDCLSRCLKHEMGHVMGLWHEHSRPDRDKYIEVHFENIAAEDQGNFATINLTQSQVFSEFDINSIMLYGSEYLSVDDSLRSIVVQKSNLEAVAL